MFELEHMARSLANSLLKDSELNTVQKARVEYGLALVLGLAIEFSLTVGGALIMGTMVYAMLIMLSALLLRIFSGGTHCSSFLRCLVFTMVLFLANSLIVKEMVLNLEFQISMVLALMLGMISLFLLRKPQRSVFAIWLISMIFPVLGLLGLVKADWLMIMALSSVTGIFIQAIMGSAGGKLFVQKSDRFMQRVGI